MTADQPVPPSGTVTFLFTDIEGSTALWEQHRAEMEVALERHDEILRSAIEEHGGYVFSTAGDAFAAAFARTGDALTAAQAVHEGLSAASWPSEVQIRVRMGVHTGEAQERDGNYFGPALNRAARIMSAGHGGQVLVSAATAAVVGDDNLVDLGEHQLKDLSAREHLLQLGGGAFPALRSLETARHNLPAERTALVGRNDDIEQVAEFVVQNRLVTLLGIGGTGKTRLATAVAAELADRFGDGVWFVDLVPATGAEQVAEAIATAAGLSVSGADLVEAVAELIAERDMLVVLDNCEHITDDVAEVVDVLLEQTAGPRFLATSREPLQLLDERHVHVPPLLVDDDLAAPAVELFVGTAERVGASVEPAHVELVSRICGHLDGLPLAIELAAAQLRQLTISEVADRLDQRFELLAEGRRGRRRRQASLLAVLRDTWGMLDDHERELLMLLATFPSSFTADDVDGLTGGLGVGVATVTLAGLVDRSLVARDGDGRHRLLETVKLFARQRWDGTDRPDRFLERHTEWVFDELAGYRPEDWYTSGELLRWSLGHYEDHRAVEDRLAAAGATADLARFFSMLTYTYNCVDSAKASSVIERIDHYLDTFDFDYHERGVLNLVLAPAGLMARQLDRASQGCTQAVELFRHEGSAEELSFALAFLAAIAGVRDTDAAVGFADEAIDTAEAADAQVLADMALGFRAASLALGSRFDEAIEDLERLRPRVETRGEHDYAWNVFNVVGLAARIIRDPPAAQTAASNLISYVDYTQGSSSGSWPMLLLACAADAATGDVHRTRSGLERIEAAASSEGDDPLPDLLIPAAALAWARHAHERAQRWLTAVRRSQTPTHGFYTTVVYRQLRDEVGLLDHNPLDDTDIEHIYQEATDWLASL